MANTRQMPMMNREQLANLDDDPANDLIFAEAAFDLFELEIN